METEKSDFCILNCGRGEENDYRVKAYKTKENEENDCQEQTEKIEESDSEFKKKESHEEDNNKPASEYCHPKDLLWRLIRLLRLI